MCIYPLLGCKKLVVVCVCVNTVLEYNLREERLEWLPLSGKVIAGMHAAHRRDGASRGQCTEVQYGAIRRQCQNKLNKTFC